jgi:DNA polymerase-3 subunit beta
MRVVLEPAAFGEAAGWAARYAAGAGNSQPMLAGVHLAVAGTTLTLRTTDGDTMATVEVPAGVAGEGEVVLPAKLVGDIARRLPDERVCLDLEGAAATLTCGTLTLELQGMPPEGFPPPRALPTAIGTVRADDLAAAVRRTAAGIGDERQQPPFRSYGILAGQTLRIAATDRYRLPAADCAWQPTAGHREGAALLVPPVLAEVAAGLPASGEVALHADSARRAFGLSWPGRRVLLPVVDAEMTPYGRALTMASATRFAVEVDRKELLDALARVSPMVEPETVSEGGREKRVGQARLGLGFGPEGLQLAVRGRVGRIAETVEVPYEGPPLELRVNLGFLTEAVRATGGERIRIGLPNASADPRQHRMVTLARVGESGYLHVVMLMQAYGGPLDPWMAPPGQLRAA